MIALDTNVLVRFLLGDDVAQQKRAKSFIEGAIRRKEALAVLDVVLCELVWVLRYSYKVPKPKVVEALRNLVNAKQLQIMSRDVIARAIDAYEVGRGDFADYLIREQARAAGAETVATFDGDLLKEDGFVQP